MSLISLQSLASHPAYNPGRTAGPLLPKVAHEAGLSAWNQQGNPGAIKALSQEFDVSRQTIYSLKGEVESAWQNFEEHGGRLAPAHVVSVDRNQLVRATIGTRAETPSSLRDIQRVHEYFYGLSVSYGTIQGIVSQAEEHASVPLSEVPLAGIQWMSIDELFIGNVPILVGVDLDTSYLFCLQKSESRSGEAWAQAFEVPKKQGLAPQGMVSDAGSGLLAGAKLAFPDLERHGDLFHAKYECLKVLSHLERRGYGAIRAEDEATRKWMKAKELHLQSIGLARTATQAKNNAIRAMYVHDSALKIIREVFEVMELVELQSGDFRETEESTLRLLDLAKRLKGPRHRRCDKLSKWLKNQARSLCAWQNHVSLALEGLTEDAVEAKAVRLFTWLWRLDLAIALPCNYFRRRELQAIRAKAVEQLQGLSLPEFSFKSLLQKTTAVIRHRHRASSLVECVNSVVRPWLSAHKHVSQRALDLFASWWNFHPRRHGRLRGSCPYTALTGKKIVDWLSFIGCPPSPLVN